MPPRHAFKGFTCSCVRGGVWIPHNSGYTQTLSLPKLAGDSQGKSSPGQQHVTQRITWQHALQVFMLNQSYCMQALYGGLQVVLRWNRAYTWWSFYIVDKMLLMFTLHGNAFVSEKYRKTPCWALFFFFFAKFITVIAEWSGLACKNSWKKPKPSMSRSSLTRVSEELWCALWQAPHLLTQGVSPGHAEVVTACALGRRGPLLTECFSAR